MTMKNISAKSGLVNINEIGDLVVTLILNQNLDQITLWDVRKPYLYLVLATISPVINSLNQTHTYTTRIGFRVAEFKVEGFYLNGERFRFYGLNRHEIYPYVGFSMPPRVMRKDVDILKNEFHTNIVRCSVYPQSEAFLDACDELGLMVWQETPGWQYVGNTTFRDLVIQNVHDMIIRDRNHPSIIIWGVRINESPNEPDLYNITTELSHLLDGTRPASGSMTNTTRNDLKNWHEDVFAYDDYNTAPDGTVSISAPLPDLPYMISEMIGQWSYGVNKSGFGNSYRRDGDLQLQQLQAVFHAQGQSNAASYANMSGSISYCGFDYGSGFNSYQGVKYPGVADIFRIPKLGASFYQSQVDQANPVIIPNFYWDFGPASPDGPGDNAAIFSNCDQLKLYVGNNMVCSALPDKKNYDSFAYPPFFCNLVIHSQLFSLQLVPDLRIDGYIQNKLILTKNFSSDSTKDQFLFLADDIQLIGDGADSTRLVFRVVDFYGHPRAFAGGMVSFNLSGPATLIGANPFNLTETGGASAVWLKSAILPARQQGMVKVMAQHSLLGTKSLTVSVIGA